MSLACDTSPVARGSARSSIAPLTAAEVRRLYLGIPIVQNGRSIGALRNGVNPMESEIFLQHVLFMSAQAYERQISARLYRSGGNRIPEHSELRTLLNALAADPWAVSYMSAENAARLPALRVVSQL